MGLVRKWVAVGSCVWIAGFGWTMAGSDAATPCRPVDGLKDLLRAGDVLVLGEIHGTDRSPAFVLDVVCNAALADLPVVVGLELPGSMTESARTFLDSAGSAEDRAALLAGPAWQSSYQDGRTSEAMFGLFDGLRAMTRSGKAVDVALFDASTKGGGQERDRRMAENLAKVLPKSANKILVVLTGNIHSRFRRGSPWSRDYEPMTYLLTQRMPEGRRLTALDVAHAGGSAWVCGSEGCGIQKMGASVRENIEGIVIDEWAERTGHHGWYGVGPIRASPPALAH